MGADLVERCATTSSLENVEVDGMSAKQLYDTPADLYAKIGVGKAVYGNCQRCVFSQCVYTKT